MVQPRVNGGNSDRNSDGTARGLTNVDRAWKAIESRTSPNGDLVNVCAGTGKQKTLQDYFDRPAINGKDDRGGAMGLMFTTELIPMEPEKR